MKKIAWLAAPLFVAGCQAETVLGSSQQMWMWLFIPLVGFLCIGAFFVWLRRLRQMRRWRVDQGEPPVRGIILGVVIAGAVPAVVFIVQNLRAEVDPRQQLWNIGLWLMGTIAGCTTALLIGLRTAEPR